MSGAISLAGLSALRAGAGLVTLAVPDRCLETVAAFNPCSMTVPLPDDELGRASYAALETIRSWYRRATCLAIGPGLGRSHDLQRLVEQIVMDAPCPVVIDADALNNLAEGRQWPFRGAGPRVLTPHPGEWSRLCGCPSSNQAAQRSMAIQLAGEYDLTIVLKGHESLISDGKTIVLNRTGTPAMATGGSGDVLTGVIAALICQGLSPRDAAHLGTHVHGLAGRLAEVSIKSHVVLPTELIGFLPVAFASLGDASL